MTGNFCTRTIDKIRRSGHARNIAALMRPVCRIIEIFFVRLPVAHELVTGARKIPADARAATFFIAGPGLLVRR